MNKEAFSWIAGDDTGTSSKTIWAVMMGVADPECNRYDVPYDPADFGRCVRLLNRVPEWRGRLGEVAAIFPRWQPLVDAWEELETLYEEEFPTGKAPRLYERIQGMVRHK
jgi:hypothetical protein